MARAGRMSTGERLKVLLLTNVPTPYANPLYARIKETAGWELTVCYVSTVNDAIGWAEEALAARVAHETIVLDRQRPGLRSGLGSHGAAAVALVERLWRARPDCVVVCGYTQLPQTAALAWAAATGTPYVLMGDANYYADHAAGWRRMAKRAWVGRAVRRASGVIAMGKANRLFWEAYGALPERLYESPWYVVDNDHFARAAAERGAEARAWRARHGLEGAAVFLYVGRLIARKGVDRLIRAAGLAPGGPGAAVVIAGDGPERAALEELSRAGARVVYTGRVANSELPLYYAAADALVLPSGDEPWGVVVNEAMASGLPVVAHRHCGAAVDLVGPDNGVLLETLTVEELAAALGRLATSEARRRALGRRSREKVAAWSVAAAARGFVRAVEGAVEGAAGRRGERT